MILHFEGKVGWKEFVMWSHQKPKEDCRAGKTVELCEKVLGSPSFHPGQPVLSFRVSRRDRGHQSRNALRGTGDSSRMPINQLFFRKRKSYKNISLENSSKPSFSSSPAIHFCPLVHVVVGRCGCTLHYNKRSSSPAEGEGGNCCPIHSSRNENTFWEAGLPVNCLLPFRVKVFGEEIRRSILPEDDGGFVLTSCRLALLEHSY
ncbi:unnamed protein product [Protopolystoma xenopodis]|uniref:Uncharacterized protein n=1 Tax=Protopolystoma xenopodis TaxID=117903 RepID=A0A448XIN4_9PLAT|nr:unnamed protein product [Protopolystoma xenopodis]